MCTSHLPIRCQLLSATQFSYPLFLFFFLKKNSNAYAGHEHRRYEYTTRCGEESNRVRTKQAAARFLGGGLLAWFAWAMWRRPPRLGVSVVVDAAAVAPSSSPASATNLPANASDYYACYYCSTDKFNNQNTPFWLLLRMLLLQHW